MPNRNGLYIVAGPTDRRPKHRIDLPLEFRRDRAASPDRPNFPAREEELISELRQLVRILLAHLADEDLGSALLDLCELRRILAEMSPEHYTDLDLEGEPLPDRTATESSASRKEGTVSHISV